MHLVGDRFSLPRNILAPFTAGSNEVFFFSRWGIWVERALLEAAPDFVLVLMEASQDTIRSRMKADPHPRQVVREADVEHVLNRFREEYKL